MFLFFKIIYLTKEQTGDKKKIAQNRKNFIILKGQKYSYIQMDIVDTKLKIIL